MRVIWDAASEAIMAALVAIPLWGVRAIVIALLGGLAIWALALPEQYAFQGAPSRSRLLDVRIWAVVVIVLEIIPYIVF
jgi:hypothetical protein